MTGLVTTWTGTRRTFWRGWSSRSGILLQAVVNRPTIHDYTPPRTVRAPKSTNHPPGEAQTKSPTSLASVCTNESSSDTGVVRIHGLYRVVLRRHLKQHTASGTRLLYRPVLGSWHCRTAYERVRHRNRTYVLAGWSNEQRRPQRDMTALACARARRRHESSHF